MIVFGGSASKKLADCVSKLSSCELGLIDSRRFPDGEHYIRVLSKVENRTCVVIQSTPTNDAIVELLLLLDTLNDLRAKEVHAIVPYMGYARQDKRFRDGEAFSAKTILKLLDEYSDSITTINCHFLDAEGVFSFESIRLRNLDAFPLVAGYFKNKVASPVVVSPDDGALNYAKKAASIIGCEFLCLNKERLSDNEVKISMDGVEVSDRDVIILDDMISTGSTIVEASNVLKAAGARSINAGCVHGVFSRGLKIFKGVVDEVVCTDTITQKVSKITVANILAEEVIKFLKMERN